VGRFQHADGLTQPPGQQADLPVQGNEQRQFVSGAGKSEFAGFRLQDAEDDRDEQLRFFQLFQVLVDALQDLVGRTAMHSFGSDQGMGTGHKDG